MSGGWFQYLEQLDRHQQSIVLSEKSVYETEGCYQQEYTLEVFCHFLFASASVLPYGNISMTTMFGPGIGKLVIQ